MLCTKSKRPAPTVVLFFRAVLIASACFVAVGCGGVEEDGEITVSSHTAALRAQSGAPTTGACITCGCSYKKAGTLNGCQVYDCVCDTESKAQCVVDAKPKSKLTAPSRYSPSSMGGVSSDSSSRIGR